MTDQPEMSPLTEPEREWVRVRRDFAAQEGVDHLDLDAVAAYYDAVLARSQAEDEELDPEELAVLLDVVAVLLGEHIAQRVPVRVVHGIAAAIFAAIGCATLLGVGEVLGL